MTARSRCGTARQEPRTANGNQIIIGPYDTEAKVENAETRVCVEAIEGIDTDACLGAPNLWGRRHSGQGVRRRDRPCRNPLWQPPRAGQTELLPATCWCRERFLLMIRDALGIFKDMEEEVLTRRSTLGGRGCSRRAHAKRGHK